MLRHLAVTPIVAILLAGCGNGLKTKEKVQAAIVDRLQTKSGLDLKALDVSTTSLSFEKNMAYATVAFHPKGDASVNHGMEMKYTLEERGGKWLVVNVSDAHGRGPEGPSATGNNLPPGHPSIDGSGPGDASSASPGAMGSPHGSMPEKQGAGK